MFCAERPDVSRSAAAVVLGREQNNPASNAVANASGGESRMSKHEGADQRDLDQRGLHRRLKRLLIGAFSVNVSCRGSRQRRDEADPVYGHDGVSFALGTRATDRLV
jgi:hypothetical protein